MCSSLQRRQKIEPTSSQHDNRVLVVGTTRDYIDHIRNRMPGRAVFVTDPDTITDSTRGPFTDDDELVCPLGDEQAAIDSLRNFLEQRNVALKGVACFDCESLPTAAAIAERWGFPFPTRQSVYYCRNKYISKRVWASRGVPCPRVCSARSVEDIISFMEEVGTEIILKPLTGSGSELTFRCDSLEAAADAFGIVVEGLAARSKDRMYCLGGKSVGSNVLCEEFVSGEEFSCDIYYDAEEVEALRMARKYLREEGPTGTAQAYEIQAPLPEGLEKAFFEHCLVEAAKALGLTRCLCMVDFICRDGRPYFLELSPRPGGDCLPPLIGQSCGLDIIGLTLDFAEGKSPKIPPVSAWEHLVGLRFHAHHAGLLQAIRPLWGEWKRNIRDVAWLRHPGDRIELPPKEYNSWLLGYAIFKPRTGISIRDQVRRLNQAVEVDII